MKTTLLFLSVFLTTLSYSQITISELIKVAKMDRDSFEIYALDKGYSYDKIEVTENQNRLVYYKKNGSLECYLKHYTKFYIKKHTSGQQTSNVDLLIWYNQLKELGFEIKDTFEFAGAYCKNYTKGKAMVSIYIKKDFIEMGYKEDF